MAAVHHLDFVGACVQSWYQIQRKYILAYIRQVTAENMNFDTVAATILDFVSNGF